MLFAGFYLLSVGDAILSAFVFYFMVMIGLYTHTLALSYLQNKKSFLMDLMDYDLDDIWSPLLIWGFGLWIIFFLFYRTIDAGITFATMDEILYNVILVVPSETFIFVVFLPEIMPEYFGAIPFTKIRIPGWFWGAGFFFGTYHFWAYQGNIWQIMIAMIVGLGFYALYKYGKKNRNVGGIMSAMAVHFNLNFWALSTVSILTLLWI
jgi:hypothetical protein